MEAVRSMAARVALALGLSAVSACLLTTSLDGLSDGASADAATEDDAEDAPATDRDGSPTDARAPVADASDAGLSQDAAPSAVLVGDGVLETNPDDVAGGQPEAFPYVAVASGVATKLVIFVDAPTTAAHMKIGLYSDEGATPAQLLAQGDLDNSKLGTWNTASIPPITIEIGKRYWIAVLAVGGATDLFAFRSTKVGTVSYQAQTAGLASLAATFGAVTAYSNSPMSAYAAP